MQEQFPIHGSSAKSKPSPRAVQSKAMPSSYKKARAASASDSSAASSQGSSECPAPMAAPSQVPEAGGQWQSVRVCVCVSVGFWVLTGGRRNHRHRIVVYGYKL